METKCSKFFLLFCKRVVTTNTLSMISKTQAVIAWFLWQLSNKIEKDTISKLIERKTRLIKT